MEELLAKDIMTKRVITISKDATLAELAKLLIKNKISCVPIVDEKEELVGIVTEADLIIKESNLPFPLSFSFAFLKSYESYTKSTKEYLDTRVEEVMSTNVKAAREDTSISKVVNIMINSNVNRLPILNNDGKLSGIITRADIIKSIIKKSKKK